MPRSPYEASLAEITLHAPTNAFEGGRVKASSGSTQVISSSSKLGVRGYGAEIERLASAPEVEALLD